MIHIAVPSEEKDEILIMAKVFANALTTYVAFFWKFPKCTDL